MKKHQTLPIILLGALSGAINGFLGGGGGVVAVTALLSILKFNQKKAQATALLCILPLAVISAVVYLYFGNVDWQKTWQCTLGIVAGGLVGALLLNKLDDGVTKTVFALVMILGGLRMVVA